MHLFFPFSSHVERLSGSIQARMKVTNLQTFKCGPFNYFVIRNSKPPNLPTNIWRLTLQSQQQLFMHV